MNAPNQYADRARLAKVLAIVSVIDRLPDPPTADEIEKWGIDVWVDMAGAADVNFPSPTTRAMLVEHVRAREAEAGHVTEIDELDPFEDTEPDTIVEFFGEAL